MYWSDFFFPVVLRKMRTDTLVWDSEITTASQITTCYNQSMQNIIVPMHNTSNLELNGIKQKKHTKDISLGPPCKWPPGSRFKSTVVECLWYGEKGTWILQTCTNKTTWWVLFQYGPNIREIFWYSLESVPQKLRQLWHQRNGGVQLTTGY